MVALWMVLGLLAPEAATPPQPVRILWFGATGGVSGHVGHNRAHHALAEQQGFAVGRIAPRAEGPGVFASEGRLLFSDGGLSVQAFRRLMTGLAQAEHQRVHPAWPALVSPFEVVFEGPPGGPGTPTLDLLMEQDRLPGARRITAGLERLILAGETFWCLRLPGAPEGWPADPADWELRFAWEGEVQARGQRRHLYNVGRPVHEGARRSAAIAAWQAQAPERSLVLAAGDDLESFSYLTVGDKDRQRPVTLATYRRLGLAGLAVGAAEAAFGLAALAAEQQRFEIPVLAANLQGAPIPGHRLIQQGEVQILLIGLTEPDLPREARRRFGATPPGDLALAVRRARAAARQQLGRPADLVIAFGHLSPRSRQALIGAGAGIDLLLADFDDHGLVPTRQLSSFEPSEAIFRERDRRPAPVVPAGLRRLGVAEIHLRPVEARGPDQPRFELQAIESRAIPVPGDAPPDPETLRALTAVRQTAYAEGEARLLPDLGPLIDADPALRARFEADPVIARALRAEGLPGRLTRGLWQSLVGNALRAHTAAELAVLPELPFPWGLSGPISRLQAAANLNLPDRLVLVRLSADQVGRLARLPADARLQQIGLDARDPQAPKIQGRPLDARETYRVLTTDDLRADPELAPLLAGDPLASPGPLRDLALTTLGGSADHPERLRRWLSAAPRAPARWTLDIRDLSLGVSDYYNLRTATASEAYAGIRETRVTTRDNLAFAARGDLSISRQGPTLEWVNRLRLEFAEARYDDAAGAAREETADALLFDTEARLRALALGPARDIDPFVTFQLASEFTPTQREASPGVLVDNPRKRRLDGALGFVWRRDWIQLLRLGAIVGQDLAEETHAPQIGAVGAVQLGLDLAPARWRLDAEARYFIPGIGAGSPTELGAWLKARTSLDVPLFDGIGVGLYLDLFGYQGTRASTTDPGASIISGLALRYDRIFKHLAE